MSQTLQPPIEGPARTERAEGYMMSSLDLRAGLETRVLAIGSLPAEVLRELQRLSDCWRPLALAA